MDLHTHPLIAAEMNRAWQESQAGDPAARHEEGGYIVRILDLSYGVDRWPRGDRSRIFPPPLQVGNRYNDRVVIAAFHTHPNPPLDEEGREWDQGPSESDRRWHARKLLPGFVISQRFLYYLDAHGISSILAKRDETVGS